MATDSKNLKLCRVTEDVKDAFDASTPASGSVYWDENEKTIKVGDGSVAGGIPQKQLISVKDFGAVGDGVTDDTAAWEAFNAAEGGMKYIPAGTYKVDGVLREYADGCIGDGVDELEGVKDVSRSTWSEADSWNPYGSLIHKNRVIQEDGTDFDPKSHVPIISIKNRIINDAAVLDGSGQVEDASKMKTTGLYIENQISGQNSEASSTASHHIYTGLTSYIKNLSSGTNSVIAGQFYATGDIATKYKTASDTADANNICSIFSCTTCNHDYENPGYSLGIETYINIDGENYPATDSVYTKNNWNCAYHCQSKSTGSPAMAGIFFDGSADGATKPYKGFWNTILIGGGCFRQYTNTKDSDGKLISYSEGVEGTVGINCGSWNSAYPQYGIKMRNAGRHFYFMEGCKIRSSETIMLYESGIAQNTIASKTGSNAYLNFKTGATSDNNISDMTDYNTVYQIYTGGKTGNAFHNLNASDGIISFRFDGTPHMNVSSSSVYPEGTVSLGKDGYRWSQLYAETSTIDTSDERLKDNILPIDDDVLDAWGDVGWVQFQFIESLEEKGESARIHTGLIAQRVKSVFEAHGLDATRYGLLCHDSWNDEWTDEQVLDAEAVLDEDGHEIEPQRTHIEHKKVRDAGDIWSLRYTEALVMEAAYQRRRADRLEARIAAIEAKLA